MHSWLEQGPLVLGILFDLVCIVDFSIEPGLTWNIWHHAGVCLVPFWTLEAVLWLAIA